MLICTGVQKTRKYNIAVKRRHSDPPYRDILFLVISLRVTDYRQMSLSPLVQRYPRKFCDKDLDRNIVPQ